MSNHNLKPISSVEFARWSDLEKIMGESCFLINCLGRLSLGQLGDLRNGNHAHAPKELVKAARCLQGCEWLG